MVASKSQAPFTIGSQVPERTEPATAGIQRLVFHAEINFISKTIVLMCLIDTSYTAERDFDVCWRLLWPSFSSGPGLILMGVK